MILAAILNPNFTSLNVILQTVIGGLASGALYALLAVALVTTYRTSGQLNFAQGEYATFGAFVVSWLVGAGFGIWAGLFCAMAITMIGGAIIERTVVRPSINRSWYSSLIVVLGLLLVVNSTVAVIWGTEDVGALSLVGDHRWVLLKGSPYVYVTSSMVASWVVLAVMVIGLSMLLNKTKIGLAYRAVSSNRESSELVGIRAGRTIAFGYGLAAAIGTVTGVLTSQQQGVLDFNLMFNMLIYAFAAATVGGFDSIIGAVIGGMIMGVVGAVIPNALSLFGNGMGPVVAMLTIFVVLMLRPQGLFGSSKVTRA